MTDENKVPAAAAPESEGGSGLSRRRFVTGVGGVGAGVVLGGRLQALLLPDKVIALPTSEGYLLVDTKKCAACDSCMLACSAVHHGATSFANSRIQIMQNPFVAFPDDIDQSQCRQCPYPACVAACPTGANHVDTAHGNVRTVDAAKCIGCERCVEACPFTPSRAQWNAQEKHAEKCDLCANTPFWDQKGGPGGKQACVEVCPMHAISFTKDVPVQTDAGYDVNLRLTDGSAELGLPTMDDGSFDPRPAVARAVGPASPLGYYGLEGSRARAREEARCRHNLAGRVEAHMPDMRPVDALVAEIGSTTTVVSAFDGLRAGRARLLGQGFAATSVAQGDVGIGLEAARASLEAELGPLAPAVTLATSSAAGGLRMTVHGLTAKMTAMAAREAALGAGAVVKYQTAGRLRDADLAEIERVRPNLVLLAGGVEGGDFETVLFNAGRLRELKVRPVVVYGGNSAAAGEARALLEAAGFRVKVTANVYPGVDELDIVPARHAIHDAFEEHITHAPGMERIGEFVSGRILPTPGAVLLAAEALAASIGDLVVVDVGGATTDVHSITDGSPEIAAISTDPQPHSKRTVEGDLGTFVSAEHVAALIPEEHRPERLPPALPFTPSEIAAASLLARVATITGVHRHAGRLSHLYTPKGRQTVAKGRDLTACRLLIGTGGALVRLPGGLESLEATRAPLGGGELLLPPVDARCALDRDYIFACCGALLSTFGAEAVVALMRRSIGEIPPA